MRKKNLLLIGYASFMMLCSGTVMGQHGVLLPEVSEHFRDHQCTESCCGDNHNINDPKEAQLASMRHQELVLANKMPVTPRRITSPGDTINIGGSTDLDNEFGAGESGKIRPGVHSGTIAVPWVFTDPGTTVPWWNTSFDRTNTNATISDIQIGSEKSKNKVLTAYTGDGFSMGWVTVVRMTNTSKGTTRGSSAWNWSDIESEIPAANFYTKPQTVPGSYGGGNMAFSFSKYTYQYFMATNQMIDGNINYNPWQATSTTLAVKSFADAYLGVSNPWISVTGVLSQCCSSSLFDMMWLPDGAGGGEMFVWHHDGWGVGANQITQNIGVIAAGNWNTFKSYFEPFGAYNSYLVPVTPTSIPNVYYTSTIDNFYERSWAKGYFDDNAITERAYPMDDDVPLVQFSGTPMTESSALANQKNFTLKSDVSAPDGTGFTQVYGGPTASNLKNYKRPTTVLLEEGNHEFESMKIKPINWFFEQDTAYPHQNAGGFFTSCCAGYMYAYAFSPYWAEDVNAGATLVDGAFSLEPNAIVYIDNSIADSTTMQASVTTSYGTGTPDQETDAILVLPDSIAGRFTLRAAGNYVKLNMAHDTTSTTGHVKYAYNNGNDGRFYKQTSFPENDSDVFLYTGNSNFTYTERSLSGFSNGGAITVAAPATTGAGSVFGVFGNYYNDATNNAKIHTAWGDPFTGNVTKYDNPGVIEIGTGLTDKDGTSLVVDGYKYYHIYSGGTLKNFEAMDWAQHKYPVNNFALNFTTTDNTPEFILDGKKPLYVLNYGSNYKVSGLPETIAELSNADINWRTDGIAKLESAIATSSDLGALQIQAAGDVHFYDAFSPQIPAAYPTEIRILSDHAGIQFLAGLPNYVNNSDTNFVAWAKGNVPGDRSCYSDTIVSGSGELLFDGVVSIDQRGKGVTLLRSEYDDVFIRDNFTYTNTHGADNGEFIMQAGQDIYGSNIDGGKKITFNQNGQKAILLEAKKTIHTKQDVIVDRTNTTATEGNIIFKAGYNSFGTTADISLTNTAAGGWAAYGDCVPHSYVARDTCGSTLGGDIWFERDATISLANDNTIQTVLRAWNSVFIDSSFVYSQTGTDVGGKTLLYAEQGNIEAIVDSTLAAVSFTIGDVANTAELRLQAGNRVWDAGTINQAPLWYPGCYIVGRQAGAEFDGNILFNKPLSVRNEGQGYTLISASRDIENQVNAPFEFTYDHPDADKFDMTAGRHIETHAMVRFNHETTHADITMQAGRLDTLTQAFANNLCKTTELGTTLTADAHGGLASDPYSPAAAAAADRPDNTFAAGGAGQGSILMFDSVMFNYDGEGTILMTALNGNIESDPYLHGTYADQDAALVFNHAGQGKTRMEAIDIKLHDRVFYKGTNNSNKNGQFHMAAYDSILTRSLYYDNMTDAGSIYITTDKLKRNPTTNAVLACGEYDVALGGSGINHGNIVLGYGADCTNDNLKDSIVFNFAGNANTTGANVIIRAGYDGFDNNPTTGKANSSLFANRAVDRGKGYGGNITFDFIMADMAQGNGTAGGYMEISTPNGNIWGKDSMVYNAFDGDLLVDAGLGSLDDTLRAVRWSGFANYDHGNGRENTLNTNVPLSCDNDAEWRTGNIMMKGATLNFNDGKGNATFRTREGFIDTYDAFTVTNMEGHLLKYAGAENASVAADNQWGDVSERDFQYTPTTNSGSVFFGADDNIMLNYGYSNANEDAYEGRGEYDVDMAASGLTNPLNPFYSTSYQYNIDGCRSIFNVNENGYMWYHSERNWAFSNSHGYDLHRMFRGCTDNGVCSPNTGDCVTSHNYARDLTLDFSASNSGGFASVATNFIDVFTKFNYFGGAGSGLHRVPGMGTLHGEDVESYGLYMKSQFNGVSPESRRATCEGCADKSRFQIQGRNSADTYEWTYIGFHDDARIHTHEQKSLLDAPVIEFFGHAELDAYTNRGGNTKLTLRADSLIFHDSAIFAGKDLEFLPYTTGAQRTNDMRYGVINDDGPARSLYSFYGPAIEMEDRNVPVLELGYQRCVVPERGEHQAPNARSLSKHEVTPRVGGDIIVAVKHDFSLPIFNTVVANHARISFISDSIDNTPGGEYVDACVRTDLLRIRNKVEFYTDPTQSKYRRGVLKMTTKQQLPTTLEAGIYPRHLHMELNSELSIPGEDSLLLIGETTIGGYGNIHENIFARANSILAPGYASLMEEDCATPKGQGKLTIHDLKMQQDAELRISIGRDNCQINPTTGRRENCTQTDTLVVQDTITLWGRIPVVVLPETEYIEEGCYLFLEYGDSLGASKEYVKNLYLAEDRYEDVYFALDFSEPGKVYLCASSYVLPEVRRYVDIPSVDGVITDPKAGRHYAKGSKDFSFTATFSGSPMKVTALGYYSQDVRLLDDGAETMGGSTYRYTIKSVVQPWTVFIGPELSNGVSNDNPDNKNVWSHKDVLYVNTEADDVVSIYTVTGVLYRKYEVTTGLHKYTLDRGVYVVTLKDGSVHKVVIK